MKKLLSFVCIFSLSASFSLAQEDGQAAPAADSVSGVAYVDSDEDDLQSDGEGGIAGAIVTLLDSNGNVVLDSNGNPVSTTSGANGAYTLTGVAPGNYRIRITMPSGGTVTGGVFTKVAGTAVTVPVSVPVSVAMPKVSQVTSTTTKSSVTPAVQNPANVQGTEVSPTGPGS